VKQAGRLGILITVLLLAAGTGFSEGTSPSVTTNDAAAVTSNSAELHGTINPAGGTTAGWFEWGTTSAFGKRTDAQIFPDGTAAITLTASIRNLEPHTTYYFRAVLYRAVAGAPVINGDVKTFTTTGDAAPPTTNISVVTGDATALASSAATLNGTVNPGGAAVSAWFDWGTSTSLGNRTEVVNIASGTTAVPISFSLKNLQPHTVYYFRVDAYRPAGGAYGLGEIKTFTTSDAPVAAPLTVKTSDATSVATNSATLNGTIVGSGPFGGWFEYGTTTALGARSDVQVFGESATGATLTQTLRNLRANTTYYFRAVGYHSGGSVLGDVLSFTTASERPGSLSITASEASAVTATSASLKASVNTGGAAAVGFFEWGTSADLGRRTDLQSLAPGSDGTFVQPLSGLQPGTTYYFRAVVATSNTTSNTSVVRAETRSFTTSSDKPASLSVKTNDASAVSSMSVELRGVLNPAGAAATGWFEWGSTSSLTNQTPAQSFAGSEPSNFSFTLTSLQPGTTYYFRAVAQNAGGSVRGEVKTFTTTRVPSTPPQTNPDVETGDIKSGYLIVTPDAASDAPTVTFTYGTVNQGAVQSQAGIIPTAMATDASMFVEVIPSISRNIGVAIANPGSSAIVVTMTLRDENGFVLGSPVNIPVQAHQQVAKFVNELFGADVIASGLRGSLRMQSPSPFAVTGLRFSGAVFSTLPVAVNAAVPATAVIIPQFAIAGGWATQIALVNNTNATLVGHIDVFDTNGRPMPVKLNGETRSTFTYSIPVGGTFVLSPRDSNGQSPL
jgi:hypothetical protein